MLKEAIIAIFLTGCLGTTVWYSLKEEQEQSTRLVKETNQEDRQMQTRVDMMNDMLFFKDDTTGLCFVTTGEYRLRAMAHIPCEGIDNPITFWSK